MDTIAIESIEFYAYHGVPDAERIIGHRYQVDVELRLDTRPAGESDDLADTVNYADVAQRIVAIGTSEQYRLLEALAERIAAALLSEFPIAGVAVSVRKPYPPLPIIAASAGVEIERTKRNPAV